MTYTFTRTDNRIVINDFTDDYPGQYSVEANTVAGIVKVKADDGSIKLVIRISDDVVIINGDTFLGTASELKDLLYSDVFKDNKGSGGSGYLVKTYAELVALIGGSGLVAGTQYEISDFATKHYIVDSNGDKPVGNPTVTGVTEPLIVTAVDVDKLDKVAKSTLYPQDIIYVDFDSDNWTSDVSFSDSGVIISGWKGTIYFRYDTVQNNSLGYDFRNCKFRRWKTDVADWDSGTTYAKGAFAKDSGIIYYSNVGSNTNHAPSGSSIYWTRCLGLSITEYWNDNPTSTNNIPSHTDHDDFYTFSENGADTYDVHCFNNVIQSTQKEGNTILLNSVVFLNSVFTTPCFSKNNIDYLFQNNTVLTMIGNIIGYSFKGNQVCNITDSSFGNFVRGNILYNQILDTQFQSYINNNIFGGDYLDACQLGFDLDSCRFVGIVEKCVIGSYAYKLVITDSISNKVFETDIDGTSIDFSAATIIYGTYNATIFKNAAGATKISYVDASNVFTVAAANA